MPHEARLRWHISHVREEAHERYTLTLAPDETRPTFQAGQYLTVMLPGHDPVEGKAYSISTPPHAPHIEITVQRRGTFSRALCALKLGDPIITSAPYGFFCPEDASTLPLVCITGGIGIAPCISIIEDMLHRRIPRPLSLFCAFPEERSVVFRARLDALAQRCTTAVHITREKPRTPHWHHGRFNAAHICAQVPEPTRAEFFLCGSMHFTRDLWKSFRAAGIPQEHIYTEGFF